MLMTVSASTLKAAQATADILIIPLFDDGVIGKHIPEPLRRRISAHLRKLDFNCAPGAAVLFPVFKASRIPFMAVVGLGKKSAAVNDHTEALRRGAGVVVQEARKHGLKTLAVTLPDATAALLTRGVVEGSIMANYRFTPYAKHIQKEHTARAVKRLMILTNRESLSGVREDIKKALAVTEGVVMARDLVNQPASALSPATLVTHAQAIANASPSITLRILNRDEAREQGFTAFLAVARGSTEEPYVIHLTYRPSQKNSKKIFIVGKGVTFDSGGLSLKPAEMMEGMKSDMAGAATVLGLFSILERIKPTSEVHGVIAACENMPSGTAYRPGDVLQAKNGKTIEVLNTDAEGRITLADALSYAAEHTPDAIIDLATLTGACMVALGETYAGLWSNDEQLRAQLLSAAGTVGEGLCALPLPEEYKIQIQSKVADLRNLGSSRYGGAITAALFLQEFVNDIPWAHLDIAGPSFMERPCLSYYPLGATGYGVRTLVEYLQHAD